MIIVTALGEKAGLYSLQSTMKVSGATLLTSQVLVTALFQPQATAVDGTTRAVVPLQRTLRTAP